MRLGSCTVPTDVANTAATYRSCCFPAVDTPAQRGSVVGVMVTWCHLLPVVAGQVARAARRVL